jgi:hypothetical protein
MSRFAAVGYEVRGLSDLFSFRRNLAFDFAGTGSDREGPAHNRLRKAHMARLKGGMGDRMKSMTSDWLAFNTNEWTWIALMIGIVLLVGLLF